MRLLSARPHRAHRRFLLASLLALAGCAGEGAAVADTNPEARALCTEARAIPPARADEAESLLREAVALAPNDAEVRQTLGEHLVHNSAVGGAAEAADHGRLTEATEHLRAALELEPDRARAAFLLGMALERAFRHDEALAPLQLAVELDPSHVPSRVHVAEVLAQLGETAEARQVLEDALARAPRNPDVNHRLGLLLQDEGDWEGSIAPLERALELAPHAPEVLEPLAAAFSRVGRPDEAHELRTRVSTVRANRALKHARAALHRDDLDEARAQFQAVLAFRPDDVEARRWLGIVELKRRHPDAAVHQLSEAARLAPQNTEVLTDLGTAYTMAERAGDAIEALERAIAIDGTSLRARVHLSIALERAGERERARREVDAILAQDPDHDWARDQLARYDRRETPR